MVYKLICTVCLISTFKWFPKDLKAVWVLNKVIEFPAISWALGIGSANRIFVLFLKS